MSEYMDLGFNKEKIKFDKNISFRISEEAYDKLQEMLASTSLNKSEFMSIFINNCYHDFYEKIKK